VNDRHSAIAAMPNNNIITLTCVVMPIIAIMVSYSDAYAGRTNADIRILCVRRNRNRNPGGSKQSNRQRSHLNPPWLPLKSSENPTDQTIDSSDNSHKELDCSAPF
jgi:hypothetical protein